MRSALTCVAAFGVLASVALLSIDYSGDFSLNDDWGYSTPVRWWVEDGVFQLTHWQSMPQVPQFLGGVLWTSLFGFSQEALRNFTALLGCIALIATYGLARALDLPRWAALLASGLLLASPIFQTLSYSFMSDVPFAALAILACWALVAALRSGPRRFWLFFGTGAILTALATLQRQTGLGIPIAFLLVQVIRPVRSPGAAVAALALLAVAVLATIGVPRALSAHDMLPRLYFLQTASLVSYIDSVFELSLGIVLPPLRAVLHGLSYLGLFLFPAVLLLIRFSGLRPVAVAGTATGALLLTGLSYWQNQLLLVSPNTDVLNWDGAGPKLVLGLTPAPLVASALLTAVSFWVSLTALSAALLRIRWERSDRNAAIAMVLLAGVITFGPHMVSYFVLFDRYTLVPALLIGLAALAWMQLPEKMPGEALFSFGLVAAGTILSAALVADHFDWQRARAALTEANLSADLHAGFEANNLAHVLANRETAHRLEGYHRDDWRLVIAKSPLDGYEIVEALEVPQRIGPTRTLYLLRKTSEP